MFALVLAAPNKHLTLLCVYLYFIYLFMILFLLRDVLPQDFDSYSPEVQKLICTADHLGTLMQYNTSGFLSNQRVHRGQR